MGWTTIFIIILLIDIAYCIYLYNRLVKQKQLVNEAWSGIDVQLKRRYDLLPNLIEVVKGYSSHEVETLTKVVSSRTYRQVKNPGDAEVKEISDGEKLLGGNIKQLFALAESYPELKASESFQSLHKSLVDIEDDLQYARRYFNGTVRDNNTFVQTFPSNLVAQAFRFSEREFFEIEYATERKNPDVSF